MVSLQPGSRLLPRRGRGRGWKEPLRGGESSSGPSPRPHRARPRRASSPSPRDARPAAQPASPRQCQLGQLVTPGRRAAPSRPPGSPGAGGLPLHSPRRPSGKRRRQKLPRAAPGGEAARVPVHRPYLALGRPRSGRAARGAWCASARAWGDGF
ncbi:translation initiation factor IF-2-like [Panthera pardus]|uniref:Translation initiation factor IF-2-like n=1 Tax=Panthera pardus TaxID=9691 RepID=A0A9V1FDK4_PANPR|nr:translation initiation factor IF-2-like [Panthera pardus]